MKLLIWVFFFCFLPAVQLKAEKSAPSQQKPIRVLFIGNSYTGWHNLPEIVAQMAYAKNKRLYYESVTPGGRNFERHWKEGIALKKLYEKQWDIVVLQNQSFEPVGNPENMFDYGKRLANIIKETGAEIVYYLTWAYEREMHWMKDQADLQKKFKKMQELLNNSYYTLASETGGRVCPAGIAWSLIRKEHPEITLFHTDGSHPSQLGSYLTALVMYASIFKTTPESMPETIYPYFSKKGQDRWGGTLRVNPEQRALFEATAQRALDESANRSPKTP